MSLLNSFMEKLAIKKKFVLLGEVDSINIELIIKSLGIVKNKIQYILICNRNDIFKNNFFKKNNIKVNEILNPIDFTKYNKNMLNIFNIENVSKKKYLNLLNQINVANNL